jgi:hypothetical protein
MRKNAIIFRFFTWIVLAAMILANVTPVSSAPLAQDEVQATPTSTPAPEIQAAPSATLAPEIQVTPTSTLAPENQAGKSSQNSLPMGIPVHSAGCTWSISPTPYIHRE